MMMINDNSNNDDNNNDNNNNDNNNNDNNNNNDGYNGYDIDNDSLKWDKDIEEIM